MAGSGEGVADFNSIHLEATPSVEGSSSRGFLGVAFKAVALST